MYSDTKFARHVACCVVGSEIACKQALPEGSGVRGERRGRACSEASSDMN